MWANQGGAGNIFKCIELNIYIYQIYIYIYIYSDICILYIFIFIYLLRGKTSRNTRLLILSALSTSGVVCSE